MSLGHQNDPSVILTPVTHPPMIAFCDPKMFGASCIIGFVCFMVSGSWVSFLLLPIGIVTSAFIHKANPDFTRVQQARFLTHKRRPSFYPLKKGRLYVP